MNLALSSDEVITMIKHNSNEFIRLGRYRFSDQTTIWFTSLY
jgi:hypothetical protein